MFLGLGGLFFVAGIIWLIVLSLKIDANSGVKIIWTFANILFNPLAGIVFYLINNSGLTPMLLTVIGTVLMGFGIMQTLGNAAP